MLSRLSRAVAICAVSLAAAACSNGNGTSLPFAGSPNNAGGSQGTYQAGGTSTALLRFIQASPDFGGVDVCLDNGPFGVQYAAVPYGGATGLFAVPGGVSHVISVFATLGPSQAGLECATAPGPYFGTAPIAVTTIAPGVGTNPPRETIVLGGRNATATRGLYVFGEPSFTTTPPMEAISHNAAPSFSIGKLGIGFGTCSTTVTPCVASVALAGAQNVAAPSVSAPNSSILNSPVTSALAAVPAGFYDGIGVAAGNPIPITSVPAPAAVAGQPYVIQLYALDGSAGALNLLAVYEQTAGYGF